MFYKIRSLIKAFEMEAITSYVRPSVVKPKIYAIKNVFVKNQTFFFSLDRLREPLNLYNTDYWFCRHLIPDDGGQPKRVTFSNECISERTLFVLCNILYQCFIMCPFLRLLALEIEKIPFN